MFWKFWKRKGGLPGPREIPELVGRYMVTEMKQNPDWVWKLSAVIRPAGKKKAFYCRVFSDARVAKAGVQVKDWTSLDEHPELVLWEGYFDKTTNVATPEKFVKG